MVDITIVCGPRKSASTTGKCDKGHSVRWVCPGCGVDSSQSYQSKHILKCDKWKSSHLHKENGPPSNPKDELQHEDDRLEDSGPVDNAHQVNAEQRDEYKAFVDKLTKWVSKELIDENRKLGKEIKELKDLNNELQTKLAQTDLVLQEDPALKKQIEDLKRENETLKATHKKQNEDSISLQGQLAEEKRKVKSYEDAINLLPEESPKKKPKVDPPTSDIQTRSASNPKPVPSKETKKTKGRGRGKAT